MSVGAAPVAAQSGSECNAPTSEPVVHVALPGNPFTPVITGDGCWIFVAMVGSPATSSTPGVAVLSRGGGTLTLERTVPLPSGGTGATLTHDGKVLVVAMGSSVVFLDADRLKSGTGSAVLGYLPVGEGGGAIYASTTRRDDLLFVALERAETILVVDLPRVRRGAFDSTAVIGRIPVGNAPIAVTLSHDGRHLYATSQSQGRGWNWPLECEPENPSVPLYASRRSKGAVLVIDVVRARADAAKSVVARVPVGCGPVRLVLTPDGNAAWVSVRGEHSVVALDTRRLLTDPGAAVLTRLRVGTAPVGVAVVNGGRTVIATNSNRFAGGADDVQSLNIIDAADGPAAARVVGTIPTGAFPRELRTSPDGRTLFVSNFASKTLQVVDLQRLGAVTVPRR
jgi:DNA-binding beta-propeller fold protein YncE